MKSNNRRTPEQKKIVGGYLKLTGDLPYDDFGLDTESLTVTAHNHGIILRIRGEMWRAEYTPEIWAESIDPTLALKAAIKMSNK